MHKARDHNIPQSSIGSYGTGVSCFSQKLNSALLKVLKPVKDFIDILISQNEMHITCRYLGYFDEVSSEEIDKEKKIIKAIYKKYLPISCTGVKLYGTWVENSNQKHKLIMLDIPDKKLKNLHIELLKSSKNFHIFKGIEGDNFKPHITLAQVREEYETKIPKELLKFVKNTEISIPMIFKDSYIWEQNGVNKL